MAVALSRGRWDTAMCCRHCNTAILAGCKGVPLPPLQPTQQSCQAVRMGKISLCQGRKQISISHCTSCRLRHGELSEKTMAPSSLSYEAILSDADVQAVKSPQLHQLSLLCLGPDSGLWHRHLLPPHHWTHFHRWEWGHETPGKFPAVSETDRQTAQDEPLLSAELGLILLTSGIKPSGHLHGLVALSRLGADCGLLGPFHPAVTWPRPSCARLVLTSAPSETGKIWRLFVLTK